MNGVLKIQYVAGYSEIGLLFRMTRVLTPFHALSS